MAKPSKILTVDDDPNVQKLLYVALSHLGCEIKAASDAEEAFQLLRAEPFDVMLLDYMLPGLNGIDILRSIREQGFGVEVIMVTAYASVESAVEALRLGAYDYITKPFQIDSIQSTVTRALEKQLLQTRFAALSAIGQAITSTLDLQESLTLIAEHTVDLLNVEAASVMLFDRDRGDLWFAAGAGEFQDPPGLFMSAEVDGEVEPDGTKQPGQFIPGFLSKRLLPLLGTLREEMERENPVDFGEVLDEPFRPGTDEHGDFGAGEIPLQEFHRREREDHVADVIEFYRQDPADRGRIER